MRSRWCFPAVLAVLTLAAIGSVILQRDTAPTTPAIETARLEAGVPEQPAPEPANEIQRVPVPPVAPQPSGPLTVTVNSPEQPPAQPTTEPAKPSRKAMAEAQSLVEKSGKLLSEEELTKLAFLIDKYDNVVKELKGEREKLQEELFAIRVKAGLYQQDDIRNHVQVASPDIDLNKVTGFEWSDERNSVTLAETKNGLVTETTLTREEYPQLFTVVDRLGALPTERQNAVRQFLDSR